MIAKSDVVYKKALIPLEAYIAKIPNDKEVLTIISQIYKSLKNSANIIGKTLLFSIQVEQKT